MAFWKIDWRDSAGNTRTDFARYTPKEGEHWRKYVPSVGGRIDQMVVVAHKPEKGTRNHAVKER